VRPRGENERAILDQIVDHLAEPRIVTRHPEDAAAALKRSVTLTPCRV